MLSSKDPERDFAAGVYLSRTPPPPAYTLYTCIHCTVYLFTQGREGGGIVEPDRLEGQQFTKLDQNTNMTVHIFSL
jgi:hypothetical protein